MWQLCWKLGLTIINPILAIASEKIKKEIAIERENERDK
jgi:hypothetical protein